MAGRIGGSGQVYVAGQDLQDLPAHRRVASGLALVPEDRGLFSDLTVGDNLQLGAQLSDGSIEPAVEMFPILGKRLKQQAGTLSGGEQQMLAVARAILAKPAVLIIDEPTQGLAPKIYETLIDAMRVLRGRDMAVLLVEQNVGFAAAIADRYYIMSGGRIVSEGGNDDLHDSNKLFEHFISG
jgi:branched-chain amino acid transport system ATP-binding protein